ncbi:MAG: AAA family ATPase [Thermohalobaculum sp.]|nr:AAA family ATPase [Thermohalobaculum sp.]
MALSFMRKQSETTPEAMVFSDNFGAMDALAEDLDGEIGAERWVEVSNAEADDVFEEIKREQTFVILTLGSDEPRQVEACAELIRKATNAELMVLLVIGDVSPQTMHNVMRAGAVEFAPYPDPPGALQEAINRLRVARTQGGTLTAAKSKSHRSGKVLAVYGVAGGVGASTFAVNLAWELANLVRPEGRRVALFDFNFQYGSIATFLDVPRREAVYELVSEAGNLDQTALMQALSSYRDRLHVLTAPRDALPLDIVSASDIQSIITLARDAFDYVVIDMPQALLGWSEAVYTSADVFYALMETDMRSAQNMFRFVRSLKAEDMPLNKLQFVLNRAPGLTDLSGKTRVKRVAESLGIEFSHLLPDGGKQVVSCCDQGAPLAEVARNNPLRREIAKVAQRAVTLTSTEAAADSA